MYLTQKTREALLDLINERNFPEDVHFEVSDYGDAGCLVQVQASNQAAVRRVRGAFPGVIWEKSYSTRCQWWEYNGKITPTLSIQVYACKEAPPTCRAIEEEVEVEKLVPESATPITYVRKKVLEKRVRWECGSDSVVQA